MTADLDVSSALAVRHERDGRTARLVVTGEVDVAAAEVLATAAGRVHPAHDRVVIDLSGVVFIDIAGYEHVAATRDALLATGCRVELRTEGMTELMLDVVQEVHLRHSPFHSTPTV